MISEIKGKVKYLHLRRLRVTVHPNGVEVGPSAKGGVTVAFRECLILAADGSKLKQLNFAFARCRADEHYCKQKGREAALNNLLLADMEWSATVMEETNLHQHFLMIAQGKHAMRSNLIPEITFVNNALAEDQDYGTEFSISR